MKCDKWKQTGRDKVMQVGACKICQECVDAAASVNVEENTNSVNVQKKLPNDCVNASNVNIW